MSTLTTPRDALRGLVEALDVYVRMTHGGLARGCLCDHCGRVRAAITAARTALAAPPPDAGEVVREVRALLSECEVAVHECNRLGETEGEDGWEPYLRSKRRVDDLRRRVGLTAPRMLAALCDLATSQAAEIARLERRSATENEIAKRLTAERAAARAAGVEACRQAVRGVRLDHRDGHGVSRGVREGVQRALDAVERVLAPAQPAQVEAERAVIEAALLWFDGYSADPTTLAILRSAAWDLDAIRSRAAGRRT